MVKADKSAQLPSPLSCDDLCRQCDPDSLGFDTTADLAEQPAVEGQLRAVDALEFALGMKQHGYNAYALGPLGIGKHAIVRKLLREKAQGQAVPSDWCYVYNFSRPHKPKAIPVPAGTGIELRDTMEKMVTDLRSAIPAVFKSDDYRHRRHSLEEKVKAKQEEAFGTVQKDASKHDIAIMQTENGVGFAPTQEGKVLPPEEFAALPDADREKIQETIQQIQERFRDILQKVPGWARELRESVQALDNEVTQMAVRAMIRDLRERFADLPRVVEHLDALEADVIRNVRLFLGQAEGPPQQQQMQMQMGLTGAGAQPEEPSENPIFRRYQINVLVDRNHLEGAPVIYPDHPTYQELYGRIEHVVEMGTLITDFTRIKAGALHRANGGYLIVDARKLLMEPFAWEGLKRALRSHEIRVESPGQSAGVISTQSLDPEPIPLDIKVIVIGERDLYYKLDAYDPDFQDLFKVTADFDGEIPRTDENNLMYARILGTMARREGLHPLSAGAVARLCDHSARLAGDSERLSAQMRRLNDLVREANHLAYGNGHDRIEAADVETAIRAAQDRVGRLRHDMHEQILRDTILIDTDGAKVGQINGLSVLQIGRYPFGKPSRITARLRMGAGRVIDIEREVELGGSLHSKGVLILSAYLGSTYATDRPLSLSASIVFEQSYGGVDGDSASSAELYTLLSALADVPVEQGFAVTGSVNQHGEVQAIGGVNEKIEGYFDICQSRGLTGKQGVLIPRSNIKHLMLRPDIVEAVRENRFRVYGISTINKGLSVVTGVNAGERNSKGVFPAGSVNAKVEARLNELADQRRDFARQYGGENKDTPET